MTTEPIRAFVTYSHRNERTFERVCEALSKRGVRPVSDRHLKAARTKDFLQQIQDLIAHAHVFVPIVTPESDDSGWVHQEIGYAVAMSVPCVPVCIGCSPDAMIRGRQAVVAASDEELDRRLRDEDLPALVREAAEHAAPPGKAAFLPEDRADQIVAESRLAMRTPDVGPVCVRIRGGLGSFSLPREHESHPIWKARYGAFRRSESSCRRFRAERIALEEHAKVAGVRMVVNGGLDVDEVYGPGAGRTRLWVLLRFLESLRDLPADRVRLAWVDEHPPHLTLAVGNWVFAESLSGNPGDGVRHTVFTTHGPTVSRRVEEFDEDLESRLAGSTPTEAREAFLAKLRDRIRALPAHPLCPCEP